MYKNFKERYISVSGVEIFLRIGGEGPPLLLLHGYPQNHIMWHMVAPKLTDYFTLICPDMRGYGRSDKPAREQNFENFSKRVMAYDMVEVMEILGYKKFSVIGHDRGGRCGYRLALDFPDRLEKLVVLDIVPTYEQLNRLDARGAYGGFHWYFMGQEPGFPEKLIGADPEFYFTFLCNKWAGKEDPFTPEARDRYIADFKNPETIRATCDEYRNNARADFEHDKTDKESGHKITCPMLVLWGNLGRPGRNENPLEIWREWAVDVRGRGLACGHFLAEELPDETAAEIKSFMVD